MSWLQVEPHPERIGLSNSFLVGRVTGVRPAKTFVREILETVRGGQRSTVDYDLDYGVDFTAFNVDSTM